MTLMEVTPAAWLHARLLIWILLVLATWSPSCAFDLFSGHPLDFGTVNTQSAINKRSDHGVHFESSIPWWRLKRSYSDPRPYPQLMNSNPLPDHGAFTLPSRTSWRHKAKQDGYGVKVRPAANEIPLPGISMKYPSQVEPLNLKNLAALSDVMEGKQDVLNRLLVKMKQKEAIKAALRRKYNIERLEKEESELEDVMGSPLGVTLLKDLREMKELDKEKELLRQHQNMKSRRAKMGLYSSYRPKVGSQAIMDNEYSPFSGRNGDQSKPPSANKAGFPVFDSYNPHSFQHDRPQDSLPVVEWFSNPAEKNPKSPSTSFNEYSFPSSSHGSFSSQPMVSFPEPLDDPNSLLYPDKYSLSGGFSDVPLNDFADSPLSDGPSSPTESFSAGFHDAAPAEGRAQQDDGMLFGFFDDSGFQDSDKDCDSIGTKTCLSDADCSCHGFYACNQGRCDIKTNMKQPSADIWHEEPIDFGFAKRDVDENKMADALLQETGNKKAVENSAESLAH